VKDCNQCGKCCRKYADGGLSASAEEIVGWQLFNPAIARYVSDGEIWCDPDSGQPLPQCPWLQFDQGLAVCAIYHNRPADCQYYPVTLQDMQVDQCEMLEPADMLNPVRAQRRLDVIMSDSRPPLAPLK